MTAPLEDANSPEDLHFKIYTALAATRLVTGAEVAGRRPGKLLRRGVAFTLPNGLAVGQVVDVEHPYVTVWYEGHELAVPASDVLFVATPVACILLAGHGQVVKDWSVDDLKGRMLAIEGRLDDAARAGVSPPAVQDMITCLPGVSGVGGDTVVRWMDELRGSWNHTSVAHAVAFAWFHRECRAANAASVDIGSTISDDPGDALDVQQPSSARRSNAAAPLNRGVRVGTERRRDDADAVGSVRGLPRARVTVRHAATVDDEGEEGDEADAAREIWEGTSLLGGPSWGRAEADPRGSAAASAGATGDESERRTLAAMNGDPALLQAYFAGRAAASAVAGPVSTKPGRTEFRPAKETIAAHQMMTATRHAGKTPTAFISLILANDDLGFERPPGVVMRLYDLNFGSSGGNLSVMHFKEFSPANALAARATVVAGTTTVNTADYSGSVGISRVADPSDWTQLLSASENLLRYAKAFCDPTTIAVAKAVEDYVRDARRWDQWRDEELGTVVHWLDLTLARFRQAVARDVLAGTIERADAPRWFTAENPTLKNLRELTLDARYRQPTQHGLPGAARSNPAGSQPADRRMSAAVKNAIPNRGTKQLCVKHLSKSGCGSRADGSCTRPNCVHERPAKIPKVLAEYIDEHLGGLHPSVKRE